jgi:hypothetical protein
LVFLGSNLGLKIFDAGSQLDVSLTLRVNPLLKINVLIAVLVLKCLQVIQFILETDHLIFQLNDLTFAFNQLCFLALQIKSLGIDELIQVINSSKLLGNVVFERPSLSGKIIRLLGLHFILIIEFVDFLSILSVSLPQIHELSLQMLLLRLQLRVQILMLSEITSESGDLSMSRVEDILLGVEFSVQIGILLLPVNEKALLIIDFLSQSRDHVDVDLNPTLVVVLHSSLLIGHSVEVLLQGEQLILQQFVFSLPLSELHGFSSQLSNESVFVVLSNGGVGKLSLWTSGHGVRGCAVLCFICFIK